jgi:predicted nucleotidyltransferase
MWLLASERERRKRDDASLADRTRDLLRAALARHVPGTVVWVYGSLVKPGRFHDWSDVDVAFESLPAGMPSLTMNAASARLSGDAAVLSHVVQPSRDVAGLAGSPPSRAWGTEPAARMSRT